MNLWNIEITINQGLFSTGKGLQLCMFFPIIAEFAFQWVWNRSFTVCLFSIRFNSGMVEHYKIFTTTDNEGPFFWSKPAHWVLCDTEQCLHRAESRPRESTRHVRGASGWAESRNGSPSFRSKNQPWIGESLQVSRGNECDYAIFLISELLFVVQYSYSCNLYNHCNSIQVAADA